VTDRAFAGADTLATSYALAAGVRQIAREQAVDIVFTGKQTIDGDTAQVGPGIAKRMGLQLLTYVSRIVETDLENRTITVERRAEGGVQVLKTALPCLITMLENTNEMRFAALPAMIPAAAYPVRKWSKEEAGIEDLGKIGLKGSPTVVSKVFGPTPRSEKTEMLDLETSSLRDLSLNLLQKIFTRHPTLESDLLMKEMT
jgi:electron transfer flavoprotein beta subunit